jgi:hypothetical protein
LKRAALALFATSLAACSLVIGLEPVPDVFDGGSEAAAEAGPDVLEDPADCGAAHTKCASAQCTNGDCVRRIFVTSYFSDGNLGGAAIADQKCSDLAQVPFNGAPFFAWLGEDDASAASKLATSNAPFVLPDGQHVAESSAALLQTSTVPLEHAIDEIEDGGPGGGFNVWTGTMPDGGADTPTSHCMEWTSNGQVHAFGGYSSSVDAGWTYIGQLACGTPAHLYCVEK